jgi:predicted nucleotidyltransferase
MDSIFNSFKLQDTLNPKIWDLGESGDAKLKPEIRQGLLKIAKDFVDSFNIDGLEIEDVLFVGSLVNYNWSDYSDIDLHVVLDKSKISADLLVVDELFDAKKNVYNGMRDIKVKGYDVELYGQDVNEKLESSKGMYSVLYNRWINKPTKEEFVLDKKTVSSKVKEFKKTLSSLSNLENNQEKIDKINQFRDKIKKYRKSGLQRGGELSNENLVFKYLRRSGFMKELIDLKTNTQDSILSVENIEL